VNNYEYIIASLPDLKPETREGIDAGAVIEEVRRDLSERDARELDFLLSAWDGTELDAGFYRKAAGSRCRFIREYFSFDLALRNAKVRWLNSALGRAADTDTVQLSEDDIPVETDGIDAILSGASLLDRELGLDRLVWDRVDELTALDIFDADLVLAFAVKLKIVDRWMQLDADRGRELLQRLVTEIKETKTI